MLHEQHRQRLRYREECRPSVDVEEEPVKNGKTACTTQRHPREQSDTNTRTYSEFPRVYLNEKGKNMSPEERDCFKKAGSR